jgi:N-acetylglutamate synthase-like GNAT family acetyltransferase
MSFLIKSPKSKSDFASYYYLRWKILRKPYDQKLGSEKDSKELDSYHVMASTIKGKLIGVGRIYQDSDKKAQIRYMAVEEDYRKNQVGKSILNELEYHAANRLIESIYLNSRESALEFYIKNGYKIIKKSHVLFGNLQHWLMIKNIQK